MNYSQTENNNVMNSNNTRENNQANNSENQQDLDSGQQTKQSDTYNVASIKSTPRFNWAQDTQVYYENKLQQQKPQKNQLQSVESFGFKGDDEQEIQEDIQNNLVQKLNTNKKSYLINENYNKLYNIDQIPIRTMNGNLYFKNIMKKRPLATTPQQNIANATKANQNMKFCSKNNATFDQKGIKKQPKAETSGVSTNHNNLNNTNSSNMSILEKHFYKNNLLFQKENIMLNQTGDTSQMIKYLKSETEARHKNQNYSFDLSKKGGDTSFELDGRDQLLQEQDVISHYIKTEADEQDNIQPVKQGPLKTRARAQSSYIQKRIINMQNSANLINNNINSNNNFTTNNYMLNSNQPNSKMMKRVFQNNQNLLFNGFLVQNDPIKPSQMQMIQQYMGRETKQKQRSKSSQRNQRVKLVENVKSYINNAQAEILNSKLQNNCVINPKEIEAILMQPEEKLHNLLHQIPQTKGFPKLNKKMIQLEESGNNNNTSNNNCNSNFSNNTNSNSSFNWQQQQIEPTVKKSQIQGRNSRIVQARQWYSKYYYNNIQQGHNKKQVQTQNKNDNPKQIQLNHQEQELLQPYKISLQNLVKD